MAIAISRPRPGLKANSAPRPGQRQSGRPARAPRDDGARRPSAICELRGEKLRAL